MAKESAAPPTQNESVPAGPPITLRDRFLIFPTRPLPSLSTPSSQAYGVEDRRDPSRQLYALVCRPTLPSRIVAARALTDLQVPGFQALVDWGTVHWPAAGRCCFVVVYDRPLGPCLMSDPEAEFPRYGETEFVRNILSPLAGALKEIHSRGVTHRAIRLSNIFFLVGEREGIALGDCLTTPPAFDQPPLFETIASATCQPAGRGAGKVSDDWYSLGVVFMLLLLGRNPVAHLSDEELLARKIAVGSYSALVGDERLPVSLIEMLRGLLCDDANERWDADALGQWMDGRRLNPLQPHIAKRAKRPFGFADREFKTARELAFAFAERWEEAIPYVTDGRLELWLRRSIEDKEAAQQVATAVRDATTNMGDRRVLMDVMMARVSIILDPTGPIRYKNFAAMPDGFGNALAVMIAEGGDVRVFAEVILREIPSHWIAQQDEYSAEYSKLSAHFRDMRELLQQTGLGGGIERCLYETNADVPCMSPLVAEEYVYEIKSILAALNTAARKTDPKSWPIDRHLAAFIASRGSSDMSRQVMSLNDPTPQRATLAVLSLLASLQWRTGPEEAHGLASWLGGLVGPVIQSYHSRTRRRAMEREIPRLVRKGSLVELYRLLDDPDERRKDDEEFAWAKAQYLAAVREEADLQSANERREEIALMMGQQSAALISVIISLFTISMLVIVRVW